MHSDELKVWSLSFGELDFVQGYRRAMRAGVTLQLVHFRSHGYFPGSLDEIGADCIQFVEEQLGSNVHLTTCNLMPPAITALISCAIWGFDGRMREIGRSCILCLCRRVPQQVQPLNLSLIWVSDGRCSKRYSYPRGRSWSARPDLRCMHSRKNFWQRSQTRFHKKRKWHWKNVLPNHEERMVFCG